MDIGLKFTSINWFLLGGHEQGTLTTPAEFVIPSQSPVPVGLRPAAWPNCGIRAASTSRFMDHLGKTAAADTVKTTAERAKTEQMNFMIAE